jgi:hypothetical protein
MTTSPSGSSGPSGGVTDERQRARTRLKKRRDLRTHAMAYLLVNAAIVVIWAITDAGGFFWPALLMVGWGVGLALNAWDVFVSSDITEQDVDREISRMHRG